MDFLPNLITFATYGSWLHGDSRGSWQRGEGERLRDDTLRNYELRELTQDAVVVSPAMRPVIELGIIEACARREWELWALNVRLQHVHVVACVRTNPSVALTAFKAFSTRRLREERLVGEEAKVWSRGGSTRELRGDGGVVASTDYVMNRQGALLPGSIFHAE